MPFGLGLVLQGQFYSVLYFSKNLQIGNAFSFYLVLLPVQLDLSYLNKKLTMINIGEIMIRTYILLITVMLLWGFNVSALKVLVTAIDPVLLTAVRIGTAGICVLIISYFLKILRLPTKEEWKTIGLITIFN